ncbi:MAG TPA: hypothetical protein P5277_03005 [Candidatus Paceibacterota bacterium]|nr:hypothetical protein [Candidatus Paceibacterota bacterium]
MDSFIKKIFLGKVDEFVHLQFQKFSKGEFREKAMINVSKSKDKYSISTTAEYANEIVRSLAERMKNNEKTKVSGVLISTRNLKEVPEFNQLLAHVEVKQFMGIKQFKINCDMTKEEILRICNLLPTSFLALSFSVNDIELKIKPKAPKSAKPSTSDKGPTVDFCKIKTKDKSIVKELVFDVEEFKSVKIKHTYLINEIILPKNQTDPAKIREMAIRKGRIIRDLDVDGTNHKKEAFFEA